MTFNEEHALETYKSLINIGTLSLKALQLLSGGAIVALLAYLGQTGPVAVANQISCPLLFFIFGLSISTLAFLFAYLTQFSLFNEIVNPSYHGRRHTFWLWLAVLLLLVSLGCFVAGAWFAVQALAN